MELGIGFWVKWALICVGIGLACMIGFLLFNRAWYAWGALGTFVVVGAVLLTIAWIHDKREAKRYEALD
jgi:hypothetical protein